MSVKKGLAVVFTDELGQHMVMMPSGEVFSEIMTTRVTDSVGERAELMLKCHVNLAKGYDDARRIVQSYKETE